MGRKAKLKQQRLDDLDGEVSSEEFDAWMQSLPEEEQMRNKLLLQLGEGESFAKRTGSGRPSVYAPKKTMKQVDELMRKMREVNK